MCSAGAEGIYMQCAAEYWEDANNRRGTQLHKLSYEERKNLPTENLPCERYVGRFDALARLSAARSNKYFKTKRIRDDFMFHKKMMDEEMVKATKKKGLDELKSWTLHGLKNKKNGGRREKIEELMKENSSRDNYKEVLITRCKANDGLVASISDLQNMVSRITDPKKSKSCLKMEVALQESLHSFDVKERSHLYKINFLSAEEFAENLLILFDTSSDGEVGEDIHLPTEDEIFELFTRNDDVEHISQENLVEEGCTFILE